MSELEAIIADSIEAQGALLFSEFMELALYHPELGFYAAFGNAGGRNGDFVTSVETGPLFAAILGDWLDGRWTSLGQPDPFHVVEGGAGVATLWRGVRKARPACFDALHWHLVERSARLREFHNDLPNGTWSSHEVLPTSRVHVVLANELLDNLSFDIAVSTDTGWKHQMVRLASTGEFAFAVGDRVAGIGFDALVPEAPVGTRLPVLGGANEWVAHATAIADQVLAFDYGASVAELARRDGAWLRTYRGHTRGTNPLVDAGRNDITCDVAPELLPRPKRVITQAEWLHENGLTGRVEQAREIWRERGQIGDLDAMFARSAITESAALIDPSGLGGFLVMEW